MADRITAFRAKFDIVIKERVTATEAKRLVRWATEVDGKASPEVAALRELFLQHRDQFEPAAAQTVAALVDPAPVARGADLPDPALMQRDQGRLQWDWLPGVLVVDEVKDSDVVQGTLSDCYMLAAFSGLAHQCPEVINNAFKDNGDGTWTVKLFKVDDQGKISPAEVAIDAQLPSDGGSISYGRGADRRELWVPLLEKAFAQLQGGYEKIGNTGSAGRVFAALTGVWGTAILPKPEMNPEALFASLSRSLEAGKAVVAGTCQEAAASTFVGTGLQAEHAYTVLGVSEEGGRKVATLRNPQGAHEPGNDGKDDGVFKVDMATLSRFFSVIYIS